jgi:hypothetical protein
MHIGPLFWDARLSDQSISVEETIAAAEAILPGRPAPDDEADPRWKAVIAVAEFIPSDPQAVWSFILRWGVSLDGDLRAAIACCALEHLLQQHFDAFYDRVVEAASRDALFADTVSRCWVFAPGIEPERAAKFDALRKSLRRKTREQNR